MSIYSYFPTDIILRNSQNIIKLYNNLSPNATNTVYVEGIPLDATEREISQDLRIKD